MAGRQHHRRQPACVAGRAVITADRLREMEREVDELEARLRAIHRQVLPLKPGVVGLARVGAPALEEHSGADGVDSQEEARE